MKSRFTIPPGILAAAVVAACVNCQGQSNLYSINISVGPHPYVGGMYPPTPSLVSNAPSRPAQVRVGTYTRTISASTEVAWYVSTNLLARQPRWDGLSTEAPIGVREACTLALSHVREQIRDVESWSVESVNLRHPDPDKSFSDVWCYEIAFTPRDPELWARVERQPGGFAMTQIVLFDGTVVPPVVLKKE